MGKEIEPFKSRRELELAEKQKVMVDYLETVINQIRRGEVTGFAIACVDVASKPKSHWLGHCSGAALGHSVACLNFKFFQVQTR